ncbi:MAG TPA: hypothetical protein VH643_16180 [Gemmataceae bacterium]
MIRRSLSACLGAAALVGSLGMPARTTAKPPDLRMNETITVQPKVAPEVERSPEAIYEALPAAVPTPTLYELRPTARRTLAGSMLFAINPALGLLPTEKALDAPHDHPQRVAGDDVFSDIPTSQGEMGVISSSCGTVVSHAWWEWLLHHWAARHQVPAPQQNEGYLSGITWGVDEETCAEESEAPSGLVSEPLPMPKEEPTTDGVTCPYLRQQRMDRHACQLADPEIGRDVLANLERLQQADDLIELAAKLIRDGCILEAMECCALVGDLCPGSPCADRAACMMLDVCLGLRQPTMASEEAAEERAIERKLNHPVSMNFKKVPLRTVIDDLRATQNINIYVDEPAFAEKGIDQDYPISLQLEQVSFKSALKLLLHEVHLTYVVKDDGLEITTENAHGKLNQCVYSVADLLEHKDLPKKAGILSRKGTSPEQRLMDVISNTISPRSWSAQGGIGTIDYFPMTKSLVVNQTVEVQDQICDLLAALRRLYDKEEQKEESLPEEKAQDGTTEPGVEQQVDGLMKACRLLMSEGLHERAAELARQAHALDPERVMADPLIYKMHLLADTPAKQPFGSTPPAGTSEESEEPATCPYCPTSGKPIQGILKQKKENKSGPTTLLVPALPPVEYEVVPALDRVLTESAKTALSAGAEEASEEEQASSLPDLIESMMGSVGVRADGARLSCEWSCGGNVYHLRYGCGCLAIWKTPDAAKVKP